MALYAQALSYAIPVFVLSIIAEAIAARMMGVQINRGMDVIASLSSGVTNILKSLLGLSVVIVSYGWMEERIGYFEIPSTIATYIVAFICMDFAGYWSHRFNHMVNLFWNRHVVHHSSEEFNLSCALRQEMSAFVGIYFFLYIPMALLGVPPKVVAVIAPIQLFAQFWYHTRLIGRMGFLEYILVTPSHHRVHHAINEIYLDRNLSQIFIIWDKLFGTFQEELEDEPPIYGTLTPANSWNPVIINFSHAWRLAEDAWHAGSWWDKVRIWFMPLGWRPPDVIEKYPRQRPVIYGRSKYEPDASGSLRFWAWLQFVVCMLMLYHMVTGFGHHTAADIAWYSAFLFSTICSYTLLMDLNLLAVPVEVIRLGIGAAILVQTGGWYGLEDWLPGGIWFVMGYLSLSLIMSGYFSFLERRTQQHGMQAR
jgi:alkylglycerol monooxygenase